MFIGNFMVNLFLFFFLHFYNFNSKIKLRTPLSSIHSLNTCVQATEVLTTAGFGLIKVLISKINAMSLGLDYCWLSYLVYNEFSVWFYMGWTNMISRGSHQPTSHMVQSIGHFLMCIRWVITILVVAATSLIYVLVLCGLTTNWVKLKYESLDSTNPGRLRVTTLKLEYNMP